MSNAHDASNARHMPASNARATSNVRPSYFQTVTAAENPTMTTQATITVDRTTLWGSNDAKAAVAAMLEDEQSVLRPVISDLTLGGRTNQAKVLAYHMRRSHAWSAVTNPTTNKPFSAKSGQRAYLKFRYADVIEKYQAKFPGKDGVKAVVNAFGYLADEGAALVLSGDDAGDKEKRNALEMLEAAVKNYMPKVIKTREWLPALASLVDRMYSDTQAAIAAATVAADVPATDEQKAA